MDPATITDGSAGAVSHDPVLDPDRIAILRAELPDAALVERVLSLYRDTLEERLAEIAGASEPPARRRAAHALRSSSLQVGAVEVAAAAQSAGRNADEAALEVLRAAAYRVRHAIDQVLAATGVPAATSERANR